MQLSIDQRHKYCLTYDREDGAKSVVFHTFAQKPNAADIEAAASALSEKRGYPIVPMLWGPQ